MSNQSYANLSTPYWLSATGVNQVVFNDLDYFPLYPLGKSQMHVVDGELFFDGEQLSGGLVNPSGAVLQFAGSVAPLGYLLCDGAAVSRTTYANLFDVIGTTYGVGNGTTTFNMPDMRGRVAVGAGTGAYTEAGLLNADGAALTTRTLGEYSGFEYPTGEIANTANPDIDEITGMTLCMQIADTYHTPATANTQLAENTCGGNMQPYLVMNYIIKY